MHKTLQALDKMMKSGDVKSAKVKTKIAVKGSGGKAPKK